MPLKTPPHPPTLRPSQAQTHATHTSFSTEARGFACKWSGHSVEGSGKEPGEGVGCAVLTGRGRPGVGCGLDGGHIGWVTWSSWMSCGMASRICTAIFTTFRWGAMVQQGPGRLYFPDRATSCQVCTWSAAPEDECVSLPGVCNPLACTQGQAPQPSRGSRG